MVEDFLDAEKEGKRIALNYLSHLGWAREWRRTVTREIRSHWTREEMEGKFRRADAMEEEAEATFSTEFDKWQNDPSPHSKAALEAIYNVLKNRHDLGFYGKRLVDRLRQRFI